MRQLLLRKPVVAWAMYDWANSAFATTIMAGFFPIFYGVIGKDLSSDESQRWFTWTIALSSLAVAVMAPILGAIADCGGSRKRFLATFAMFGVLMTAGLAYVNAGQWMLGLAFYGLGTVGFSGANIFYDSMIVDVSDKESMDLVSTYGYSVGYLGGGLLFAINVVMISNPDLFGLPDKWAATKASFISVAVWWALFTVPILLFVKEEPTQDRATRFEAVRAGLKQLADTAHELKKLKVLMLFLVAYWLYIDGVNTVIKMAVFFGDKELPDVKQEELVAALLLTQFVAFPAALIYGLIGKRIGAKIAILWGLAVYVAALLFAWKWLWDKWDFYALAIVIGLVQGGVQGLSRSLYGQLIPVSKTAEFFGFFNMVGKFAAILGPLLWWLLSDITGDQRDGILAVPILFVIGGILLWRVDVEKGKQMADEMEQDA